MMKDTTIADKINGPLPNIARIVTDFRISWQQAIRVRDLLREREGAALDAAVLSPQPEEIRWDLDMMLT